MEIAFLKKLDAVHPNIPVRSWTNVCRATQPPDSCYCAGRTPHTFCSSFHHCVFSTKERRKSIPAEMHERLWAYMGGIARQHGITAVAIGGLDDHVHLLIALPATVDISTAMRHIKSGSSRFLHDDCSLPAFEWLRGYGAFSIGHAQIAATVTYIARQKEHHRRRDFQAEFLAILEKHRITFDPLYIWD